MDELELVFVVGCQRSGTTLTGQILGAHPAALLIDEQDGLYPWFDTLAAGGDTLDAETDRLLRRARKKYVQPGARARQGDGPVMRPARRITHLVFKAPNLTYAADRIAALGHKVHVVYPVRDPRAVVASMGRLTHVDMVSNQTRWMHDSPALSERLTPDIARLEREPPLSDTERRAIVWRVKSGLADTFEVAGLSPHVVRYEELVADPEARCRALALHCGLTPDPAMHAHESVYVGHSPDKVTPRDRPVDTRSLARWEAELSAADLDIIAGETEIVARELGYRNDRNSSRPTDTAPADTAPAPPPVILAGRGGGGTRLFSELLRSAGVCLGNDINETGDSVEWVDTLYAAAINSLGGEPVDIAEIERTGLDILERATASGLWSADKPWGWKLPESVLALPAITQAFPEARIVHLLRHPVSSSLRRTHVTSRANNPVGAAVLRKAYATIGLDPVRANTDDDYVRNAVSWLFQVRQVRDFGRNRLSPGRYLELRYEDLCSRPRAVITRLAAFTGIAAETFAPPVIDTSRLRAFELGDPRIEAVWDMCGDVARSLGYGLSADGLPIVSGNV